MIGKAENQLILGTLIGVIAFYVVLGGFKRLSELKNKEREKS
jgi:hypothetical protein